MKYYTDADGVKHTYKDILKANSRIVYWVIIPQCIEHCRTQDDVMDNNWYSSNTIIDAKTFKQAKRLMRKYKAAQIERLLQCDYGRWCIDAWNDIDFDGDWDKWCETYKPIIVVDKKDKE